MEYRQHIYLILKEAINNLVKYAGASRCIITVSYHDDLLEVDVRDDGRGFNMADQHYGNGILSMQNRAQLMRARLIVDTEPGRGTRVTLRVKIKRHRTWDPSRLRT